jgi:hypothetical protein
MRTYFFQTLGLCVALFSSSGLIRGQDQFKFAPEHSDFSVVFSNRPTIKRNSVPLPDGRQAEAVTAELTIPFQRAEIVKMPEGNERVVNKEQATESLSAFARQNGLSVTKLTWEITPLGPSARLLGTKTLSVGSTSTLVTFETVWYYGPNSAIGVTVGGPSRNYPTTDAKSFLNSVRRIDRSEVISAQGNGGQPVAPGPMTTYRDGQYPFSVWYPSTWAPVTTTHAATRLKVISERGLGSEDINVVALYRPELLNTSPRFFVDAIKKRPERASEELKKVFSEVNLLKSGETTLNNQPAYFTIADVTYSALGISVPMRVMQVMALRDGNIYFLTFRSSPEEFESMMPTFQLIALGFVVRPTP